MTRQELYFKKYTWIINGIGWLIFHISFGFGVLCTLIPILFIQPFICYKTKNYSNGIIIHATLNGPTFIAIAFGLL